MVQSIRARRLRNCARLLSCTVLGACASGSTAGTSPCPAAVSSGADSAAVSGERRAAALPELPVGPHVYQCGEVTSVDERPFTAIRRLASSREPVRILVYGQSTSEQTWWWKTKQWLERTYPNGSLVMEMHAHGGCAAQCLIGHEPYFKDGSQWNHLPEDVFAFRPDLIIFNVTGDHVDYGFILKAFRDGCAAFDDYRTHDGKDVPEVHCSAAQRALSAGYKPAEVLVQNDFTVSNVAVVCPEAPGSDNWACFMNEHTIPYQVARYGYRLQDNFHGWPGYVEAHNIDPATLLGPDHAHLSDTVGNEVMFQFAIRHLCFRP